MRRRPRSALRLPAVTGAIAASALLLASACSLRDIDRLLSDAPSASADGAPSGDASSASPDSSAPVDGGFAGSTWVELTGPTGTAPVSFGMAFRKGDVPTSFALDAPDLQVDVKRRWNDGSVKHAIVTGTVALQDGAPRRITVVPGEIAAQSPMTCDDIAAAKTEASIQYGPNVFTLSSLYDKSARRWLSGDQAVECHYIAQDPDFVVSFHVRRHRSGATFVRVIVEYGLINDSGAVVTPTFTVTIGGETLVAARQIEMRWHTRWMVEKWLGDPPLATPRHDTAYLRDTRLVPSYFRTKKADDAKLDGLTQAYVINGPGDFPPDMSGAGPFEHEGILPNHDALYLLSAGDPRAYRAVLANAKAFGTFPIVWRDAMDLLPARPSVRGSWTTTGAFSPPSPTVSAGTAIWAPAHHPSAGYLAYLLTGELVFLETMQHQASLVFLGTPSAGGAGLTRQLRGETRSLAWALRTLGQLAAVGPSDDPITNEYATLLGNNVTALADVAKGRGANVTGLVYEGDPNVAGPGTIVPANASVLTQVIGHLADIEPLTASAPRLDELRAFVDRWPVGLLGDGSPTAFCFTQAASAKLVMASGSVTDIGQFFDDWGQIYRASYGAAPCGTTLLGSPEAAPTNAWGPFLPAIAHAVDHGSPGAAAAFARLRGATNWQAIAGADWGRNAAWAIVPRGSDL